MEDAKKLDVDDMVFMPEFTGQLAVKNVENRFHKGKIYTNVSSILISINPYKDLGLYKRDFYDFYQFDKKKGICPPHLFDVARTAYRQMLMPIDEPKNQSVLISGESGAGKTEATKLFLRYFTRQSNVVAKDRKSEKSIEKRILQANPILEAFGNAKTLRNDNSSRFGRWLNVYFSDKGQIMMSSMTKYLLEESRVVFQDKGERSYNVFYQACAAWEKEIVADDSPPMKPQNLSYLNKSGCYTVEGADDYRLYEELMLCFHQLGFSEEEQSTITSSVKAVLALGNVNFIDGPVLKGKGSSKIVKSSEAYANLAARCLGIDEGAFKRMLMIQDLTMPSGSFYSLPREVPAAVANRNSLAKAIYGRLFTWLVHRINISFRSAYSGEMDPESMRIIGILDIFGFEAFKHNSFEQLCINFANEKLQQYFVKQVFKMELKLYQEEKINVRSIPYPDNSDTLALLEKKNGVFLLLRDELKVKTGTDAQFASKLQKLQRDHPKFVAPRMMNDPTFTIKHFAEPVVYSAIGFLQKNRSKLTTDVEDLMRSSSDPVVQKMFEKAKPQSEANIKKKSEKKRRGRGGRSKKKKGTKSLAAQFQKQLSDLMTTIQSTESHFVRCIKPNKVKKHGIFEEDEVMRQMTTCGVIDAVTVRKLGYTNRMSHWMFFKRYGIIQGGTVYYTKGVDFKKENLAILAKAEKTVDPGIKKKIPIALWQSGTSLVFYKPEIMEKLEELLRVVHDRAARKIAATCKMWIVRRHFERMKEAYRELRAAMHNPNSTLAQIEGALKRCKELKVIERLLQEAEKSIAKLVHAREVLKHAISTSKSTIIERVNLMKNAMKEAEGLIKNSKEQKVIKNAVPVLLKLHSIIPQKLDKAYSSQDAGVDLVEIINEASDFLGRNQGLVIALKHKREVANAISTIQKLDEAEMKLSMAKDDRKRHMLEKLVKQYSEINGKKFKRPIVDETKSVIACILLEEEVKAAIASGEQKKLQSALTKAEKEMKSHSSWASQPGSKLNEMVAEMAKTLLVAGQLEEAISRLKDSSKVAESMGEAGISLLQDSIAQAKHLCKEAAEYRLKVNEALIQVGKASTALEQAIAKMGQEAQEAARKKMEEKEKRLKEVAQADKVAESAKKEADEAVVAEKIRELQAKALAEQKAIRQEVQTRFEEEMKSMWATMNAKDEQIKRKDTQMKELKEKIAKVESESKSIKKKLDALFNPTDLVTAMQATIIKHAQQLTDASTLISWYTTAVFKGLNAKPLSQSLQLLQVQTLMGRPEVQTSGVVPFLEKAVREMTAQAIQGEEPESEDEPPPPPSPPSESPPPSPKWRTTRDDVVEDPIEAETESGPAISTFGNYTFDESKYTMAPESKGELKEGKVEVKGSIVPPPLVDSSDDDAPPSVPMANLNESKTYDTSDVDESVVEPPKKLSFKPLFKIDEDQEERLKTRRESLGIPEAACKPLVPDENLVDKFGGSPTDSEKFGTSPTDSFRTKSTEPTVSSPGSNRNRKGTFFSLSRSFMGRNSSSKGTRDRRVPSNPRSKEIPDLTYATVIREGYLRKRGGVNADKALKRRYFRLVKFQDQYFFSYFAKKYDKKELGVIVLSGATVSPHEEKEKYLKIQTKEKFGVPPRLYLIKAETLKHRDAWLQQLRIYCNENLGKKGGNVMFI